MPDIPSEKEEDEEDGEYEIPEAMFSEEGEEENLEDMCHEIMEVMNPEENYSEHMKRNHMHQTEYHKIEEAMSETSEGDKQKSEEKVSITSQKKSSATVSTNTEKQQQQMAAKEAQLALLLQLWNEQEKKVQIVECTQPNEEVPCEKETIVEEQ